MRLPTRHLIAAVTSSLLLVIGAGTAVASVGGPDVSSYQHPTGFSIDWAKAHSTGGADFGFVKATEGSSYTNPYFARDFSAMSAAKMVRGAYHFARPSGSAVTQARRFVAVAGNLKLHGDLPPVLDLEVSDGLGPTALIAWTRSYLGEVKRLTGRDAMIYTYPSFWKTQMANTTAFTSYPLWIATYGSKPQLVGGWSFYTFWQYTDRGALPGMPGPVDMSVFNGTLDRLWVLANGRAPVPAPPKPVPAPPKPAPVPPKPAPVPPKPAPVPPKTMPGFNGDTRGDVLGRTADGGLYLYPAQLRSFAVPTRIASGWNVFSDFVVPGDFTGDHRADVLARTPAGKLYLYVGNGKGGFASSGQVVGTGWNAFTEIAAPGDLNGDGRVDLLGRTPGGDLYFFAGNGRGGFASAGRVVGRGGWSMFVQLITPGDFTGDGRADVIGRTSSGLLYLYPGLGNGGFGTGKVIGRGFNVFNTVISSGDLTGDGKADLIARTPDRRSFIYVGNGKGALVSGNVPLGSQWGNTTRLVGAH